MMSESSSDLLSANKLSSANSSFPNSASPASNTSGTLRVSSETSGDILEASPGHRSYGPTTSSDGPELKSSSTEGPDSNAESENSSPIPPIETPPYYPPRGKRLTMSQSVEEQIQSSTATVPKFKIRFEDTITKDGNDIVFTLNVKCLIHEFDYDPQNSGQVEDYNISIKRTYDDFEYLHHTLTTFNALDGIIVPPLPPRPPSDPAAAESRSKKQLGSGNRLMRGDNFVGSCRALEKYMQTLVEHPLFSRDAKLQEFLNKPNPPIRTKLKKGFFSGMMKASFEDPTGMLRRRHSVADPDETFAKEREWALSYGANIKDAADKFNALINAQLRLSNQMSHLATALGASIAGGGPTVDGAQPSSTAYYNKLNNRFSKCLDVERKGIERSLESQDEILGAHLTRWNGFMEAENAMLNKRTNILLERDAAIKAFEKVRAGPKADSARAIKEDKERAFDHTSKVASAEVKRFHNRRIAEMRECLIAFAQDQVDIGRETVDNLASCLEKIQDFPVPEVGSSAVLDALDDNDGVGGATSLSSASMVAALSSPDR